MAFAVLYGHIKTLLFQEALHQLQGDALVFRTAVPPRHHPSWGIQKNEAV